MEWIGANSAHGVHIIRVAKFFMKKEGVREKGPGTDTKIPPAAGGREGAKLENWRTIMGRTPGRRGDAGDVIFRETSDIRRGKKNTMGQDKSFLGKEHNS